MNWIIRLFWNQYPVMWLFAKYAYNFLYINWIFLSQTVRFSINNSCSYVKADFVRTIFLLFTESCIRANYYYYYTTLTWNNLKFAQINVSFLIKLFESYIMQIWINLAYFFKKLCSNYDLNEFFFLLGFTRVLWHPNNY